MPLLRSLVVVDDVTLTYRQEVVLKGETVASDELQIVLKNGEWTDNNQPRFIVEADPMWDWSTNDVVPFIQTTMTADVKGAFRDQFLPNTYTVYSGEGRKTFFSDGVLKMVDRNVIYMVQAYAKWADGFPACEVDPSRDVEGSVIMINPYKMAAVVTIYFEGRDLQHRQRVDPGTARRVGLAGVLKDKAPWSGQLYVHGPNRVANLYCSHSLADPADIGTVEHFCIFRGTSRFIPFANALYDRRLARRKGLGANLPAATLSG
jgi:hypothetical protein